MENRKVKQVLGVGTSDRGEDIRKGWRRVEGEYGGDIMYSCMKMENETC
jgi:hypothetical protein